MAALAPVVGSAGRPELGCEPIVVVKATEHRVCHDLDRAVPGHRRDRPRQAQATFRNALDSLMKPAFVVVGDVCHDGAAKMLFRRKMKWFKHSRRRLPMNRSM